MNTRRYLIMGFAAFLLSAGCKPTEKNYKSAYDTAIQKQQRDVYDADLGLDKSTLRSDGDPYKIRVGVDSVFFIKQHLQAVAPETDTVRQFNVAVARYKMPTNVKAQTENLRTEGYEAYAVKNSEPLYFVIAAGFDSLPQAARFVKEYQKKHRKASYIGQPGAPVIHQAIRFTPKLKR